MDFTSHLTSQVLPLIQYYYEKSFLTKPFNDSIYLSFTKEAKFFFLFLWIFSYVFAITVVLLRNALLAVDIHVMMNVAMVTP